MITIYHNNQRIIEVVSAENLVLPFNEKDNIAEVLVQMALNFPKTLIVWCNEEYKEFLDLKEIKAFFHHNKMIFSYNPLNDNYLGVAIGYVEESPFIKINKKVSYPTWQMSSYVGVVHASLLIAIKDKIKRGMDFDYYLNSVAKLCTPFGLLCYSEPRLLNMNKEYYEAKTNKYSLFRFVKQHYKAQWIFLLLFNFMIYERKFPLLPFLFSLFYKSRKAVTINLDDIKVQSSKRVVHKAAVDVIIPTIGRKTYLYDVLKDFSKQTHLPQKIIIVEQNPVEESTSELDYLTLEKWPFEIQHIFIHQAGACNARNLALDQTQSEWVFLADDDNRFEANLLADIFDNIMKYGNPVVTTSYPQKHEIKKYKNVIQWPTFGAGNSFVRKDLLKEVRFSPAFEFGYGEDGDFGMQLRNQGIDVLYLPEPEILHLKAPIGGFRTTPVIQWQNEVVQPKPSPMIMLYQISHHTPEQIFGYKTNLFFKYYIHQKIKNPIRYYFYFQQQWERSVYWANELKQQNEV